MFRQSAQYLCRYNSKNAVRFTSTEAGAVNATSPAVTPAVPATRLERFRNWRSEKFKSWKRTWEVLFSDYKEVYIDTVKDVKEKPRKAAAYMAGIGAVLYSLETNPLARTYYAALIESEDDLILVSNANRNTASEERLKFIRSCYNQGTIRCLNLGLFSLIWVANYHPDCGIYKSQCDFLKPGILNFHRRVVDVGFIGQWWVIKQYMKDHDINPEEFK